MEVGWKIWEKIELVQICYGRNCEENMYGRKSKFKMSSLWRKWTAMADPWDSLCKTRRFINGSPFPVLWFRSYENVNKIVFFWCFYFTTFPHNYKGSWGRSMFLKLLLSLSCIWVKAKPILFNGVRASCNKQLSLTWMNIID